MIANQQKTVSLSTARKPEPRERQHSQTEGAGRGKNQSSCRHGAFCLSKGEEEMGYWDTMGMRYIPLPGGAEA
jgi:hypothetical protein